MIYNLYQYLIAQLPIENIFCNVKDFISGNDDIPDRMILLIDTGGSETPWFLLKNPATVQILTRDIDSPKSRELAYVVRSKINNKFGLILPQITVDSVVYPSVQVAQISSISLPQSIGYDDNGRSEWSSNYKLIYKED